jgi:cyclophilin family peptidyl-prolyl cis-trans isomerase
MSLKFIAGQHTQVHCPHVHERIHLCPHCTALRSIETMNRLWPLLSVVVLLVAGGFYLTRDRDVAPPSVATDGAVPAAEQAAAEPEPTQAPPEETELEDAPPVPEGFEVVAPLSDTPRRSFEAADQVVEAGRDYAAVIETTKGVIVVDLYQDDTPVTVNNFVFLALHRYYDGVDFHRVLEDFMAQTGDPTGSGGGGPGYRFDDEIVPSLTHDAKGVLSMANAGPGTNGSQFFITFTATPWLDGAHTVFGRVTGGLEVLDALQRVDPQTPSVVTRLDDEATVLRDSGVDVAGDGTVAEVIERALGAPPVAGQRFELAGHRGVVGTASGVAAVGFFPFPDRMERVTIVSRAR